MTNPGTAPLSATPAAERRQWWTAVLFIVGSALFALGAVPPYAEAVGLRITALTFFLGSLFFTAAAFLQYRTALDGRVPGWRHVGRLAVWPRDIDWPAAAVQLAGTLWFNWSTGNALRINLSAAAADQRVWRPDALGCVAFLGANGLALAAAHHDAASGRPDRTLSRIAALNLLGSIAFAVSAAAAYVVPASGDVWHAELSDLGTLVGALCFLLGAILLLPQPMPRTAPGTLIGDDQRSHG